MTYFLLVVVILQLAFPDAVYLVDAIEGGKELIQACKPALESDHVTKVIHDCKRDSEVPNYALGTFSLLCFLFVLLGDCRLD
jgi:ribonuclease D